MMFVKIYELCFFHFWSALDLINFYIFITLKKVTFKKLNNIRNTEISIKSLAQQKFRLFSADISRATE